MKKIIFNIFIIIVVIFFSYWIFQHETIAAIAFLYFFLLFATLISGGLALTNFSKTKFIKTSYVFIVAVVLFRLIFQIILLNDFQYDTVNTILGIHLKDAALQKDSYALLINKGLFFFAPLVVFIIGINFYTKILIEKRNNKNNFVPKSHSFKNFLNQLVIFDIKWGYRISFLLVADFIWKFYRFDHSLSMVQVTLENAFTIFCATALTTLTPVYFLYYLLSKQTEVK